MPSPFPGMDPYLEGPDWGPFHTLLAGEFVRQLAPVLRPRYLVYPDKRFVMEAPEDPAEVTLVTTGSGRPDVSLVELAPSAGSSRGGAAVLAPPLRLETVVPEHVPQVSVEIRDAAERRLVTSIGILSPTNKRGEGRAEYLAKRNRILRSTAHLVEIDLLRQGQRVPMREPLPGGPYFVIRSRANERPLAGVWPVPLEEPLPRVGIPLLAGDDDVALDLQAAFTSVYDLLGCDLTLDYSHPLPVPLAPAEQAWAASQIRAWRDAGGAGAGRNA